MEKHLREVREGKITLKPRTFENRIVFDENCVSIISIGKKETAAISLAWSEIIKVHAFKRDLFSIDCICVFLARADDSGIELSEDMQGWKEFIDSLPKHLVGCRTAEQWLREVTFPPFETKMTMIFSRDLKPSAQGVSP